MRSDFEKGGVTVKTTETDIIVYKETDIIECPGCLKNISFHEFTGEDGHRFPVPDKTGDTWKSMYYRCPCGEVLVYDPGDGTPKRLVKGKILK